MIDFVAHLTRQAAASRGFFGPGARTKGVIDHIKKELDEVEKCYEVQTRTVVTGYYVSPESLERVPTTKEEPVEVDPKAQHTDAAREWADVAILGMDGLLRAISAANPDWHFDDVAARAAEIIVYKQGKNELRDWPDWRQSDPEKAIEHVRGKHD